MAIGRREPVIDAAARVAGGIEFVADQRRPRMLHAAVLRSPHAHARIRHVDVRRAAEAPGVRAVLTRDDIVASNHLDPAFGFFLRDQMPLATDVTRYAGEPVAAVAAVDADAAQAALDLIDIEYEPLPPVMTIDAALAPDAPLLHPGPRVLGIPRPDLVARQPALEGTNTIHVFHQRRGDADAAFARAEVVVENTFESPALAHVPLEAHGAIAEWTAGRLTVWTANQAPHLIASQLATMFRLPLTEVRVVVEALGGGFGSKVDASIEPIVALLARKARRPVRLILSRYEEFLTHTKHAARIRLTTGALRDGTLVAHRAVCWYDGGAYAKSTPEKIFRAYASMGPYRVDDLHVDSYGVYTNKVPAVGFRGFGIPQVAWAHESQMDELASTLGIDPVELRLRNLLVPGDRFSTGETIVEDLGYPDLLKSVAQRVGWVPGELPERRGSRIRAKGVAVIIKGMSAFASSSVARLDGGGGLSISTSSVDMGQGVRTALAQIASTASTVPVDLVSVSTPDTAATPFDQMTTASRTTSSMGRAVRAAVIDVVDQLVATVAAQREVAPADIEIRSGAIGVRGSPDTFLPFGAVVARARDGNILGHGSDLAKSGLDLDGQGIGSPQWHPCACAAEVEVDTETGHVEVRRLHLALYVGTVVNPVLCELQVEGAALFGIGQALFEELVWDEAGVPLNASLADYFIPSIRDLPDVLDQTIAESDEDRIHGIGETGVPAVPPAIGNAVSRAIGARMASIPLTPERVLRAMLDGGR